jgi:hypothetical protein
MVDNLALQDGQEGIEAFIQKRKPIWSHWARMRSAELMVSPSWPPALPSPPLNPTIYCHLLIVREHCQPF